MMKVNLNNRLVCMSAILIASSAIVPNMFAVRPDVPEYAPEEKTVRLQPEPFTKINLSGVANITFEMGSSYSLVMEGETRLVENLSVESTDGTLYIKKIKNSSHNNNNNERAVEIRITAPYLEEYACQGVGNLELSGTQTDTDLALRISGVSNVNLKNFETRNLKVRCSGVGNVKWDRLKCKALDFQKSGVSNVNGKKLNCTSFVLNNSGVGDAHIDGIRCDFIECNKSGVGSIKLKDINCDELVVKNSGHGKVTLAGKTNTFKNDKNHRKRVDSSSLRIRNR